MNLSETFQNTLLMMAVVVAVFVSLVAYYADKDGK